MERKFSTLLEKCPEELRHGLIHTSYKPGEDIIQQGSKVNCFYYILNGLVKVFYETPGGKSHIQNILENGEIFGELEVVQEMYGICTVQAIKETEIITIPRNIYMQWLNKDSAFSMFIIETICDKFYLKSRKISEDALYPLQFRLINQLLLLSKKRDTLKFEIDKHLMAEELATSLRSLNRLFQDLKDKDLISVKKNFVEIIDSEGLALEKSKYL